MKLDKHAKKALMDNPKAFIIGLKTHEEIEHDQKRLASLKRGE